MPRGRPRTGRAVPAAERMRAYRRRLRERGLAVRRRIVQDPVALAVRFPAATLLTPGERDVLRRFCAGLGRLPALPQQVSVFGSRATGGSTARSDLDVAVVIDTPRSAALEQALFSLAARAQAPYQEAAAGIRLKPVPIFAEDRGGGFFRSIRRHMHTVWTRPR
ncbi:MAG: nucleotidyltransferase domain-containing protein [Betaproteobacteria bacterium]